MPTTLLSGGTVYDGTGADPFVGDVLVADGRIDAVGDLNGAEAGETIDLAGLALAPGLIDVHTHSDFAPFLPEEHEDLRLATIRQGVTTEICGNCGFSPFPTLPQWHPAVERHIVSLFGARSRAYGTFAEYEADVGERPLYSHLAVLVGHGTIRAGTMGFADRASDPDELATMQRLLAEALEQGAVGLSSGLIYPPGVYAPADELVRLARVVGRYGRPYATHMRDEADHVTEAIDEALYVAQRSGVPLHISHHKVAGRRNWGRSDATLAQIEHARRTGVDVTIDAYPYLAGSTMLRALLPPWANEGGVDALLERLGDQRVRVQITRDYETGLPHWQDLVRASGWDAIAVASSPRNRLFEGRRIADLAGENGVTPVEFVCDLLVAEDAAVTIVAHMMEEGDVRRILAFPEAMIGSDGIPLPGKPHPRWAGSFVRILGKYAREESLFALAEAIRKMTSAAADRFNLADRGRIAPRLAADLVVFDPATVGDRATYDEPLEHPIGIRHVLVDGVFVLRDGEPTHATPGRILKPA
jgi:N-acyl-D-aspartate/D-glutamate deacylase